MNVLVIAPHMDDEVLGCGGTIGRHVDEGDHVSVCIVANRAYGHIYDPEAIEREKAAARAAQAVLGYQDLIFLDCPDERLDARLIDLIVPLEKVCQEARPHIAYVCHRGDMNQDHRAVFEAALVACRPYAASSPIRSLRAFEVPSSTDFAPPYPDWTFAPNLYVDIAEHLDKKIAALRCYEREMRTFPHPRSPEGLRVYAQKRGMEAGMPAAEAFSLIRELVPAGGR